MLSPCSRLCGDRGPVTSRTLQVSLLHFPHPDPALSSQVPRQDWLCPLRPPHSLPVSPESPHSAGREDPGPHSLTPSRCHCTGLTSFPPPPSKLSCPPLWRPTRARLLQQALLGCAIVPPQVVTRLCAQSCPLAHGSGVLCQPRFHGKIWGSWLWAPSLARPLKGKGWGWVVTELRALEPDLETVASGVDPCLPGAARSPPSLLLCLF